MKKVMRIAVLITVLCIAYVVPTFALMKDFVRDYTYQAGEDDSKRSSRTRAVAEVKRALLEELGTYVESTTEVKNYMLTKDEITAITAGITQLTILEEKWDGEKYYIKALIKADPDDVEKRIKSLVQERSKIKELEDTLLRERLALEEAKKLQEELKAVKEENQRLKLQQEYNTRIDNLSAEDYLQQGNNAYFEGRFTDALNYYLKAISLQPQHFGAYYSAGLAKAQLRDYDAALSYYEKSLALNPHYADTYYNIGSLYFYKNNYSVALQYYLKSVELNPNDVASLYNAGSMYVWLSDYKKAIPYLEKAVELDPKHHAALYNLGICYGNLGYEDIGVKMMKQSARLGNEKAQQVVREWGETW